MSGMECREIRDGENSATGILTACFLGVSMADIETDPTVSVPAPSGAFARNISPLPPANRPWSQGALTGHAAGIPRLGSRT
ncbi:hypothetical protein [Streptomyces sp. BPTC-684]|uniref:hypothetical protein n=1 Tax=Streptomyces sp. BPTC-684 TaxID=3043734 RepID=UPI0024B168AD|nr:hypothetical protein [Streptomyces sp. BPTC-684]WHM40539.1 hypothetical protein QIY60_29175 [Streptomyces sp. BPTC-684]